MGVRGVIGGGFGRALCVFCGLAEGGCVCRCDVTMDGNLNAEVRRSIQ